MTLTSPRIDEVPEECRGNNVPSDLRAAFLIGISRADVTSISGVFKTSRPFPPSIELNCGTLCCGNL